MKRYLLIHSMLISIIAIFFAANALAELTVGNYTLVCSTRVTRVEYEYIYHAQLNNDGMVGYTNVSAFLVSHSPYTVVVDKQLGFPDVASNANVNSSDTFTIRHNRSYPLNWSDLTWSTIGTVMPHDITISGMVVGGAPLIGTINLKDSSVQPRSTFSGIGIDGSYTLNIDSSWQPPFLLWADGYVNGRYMTMLSYLPLGNDKVAAICNVTPATTAIVASAIGVPIDVITPATAPIPSTTEVDSVKEKVQHVLQEFLSIFDLPDSFDLFESPIEVGSDSDLVFDAVDFSTDPMNNVAVTSKMNPVVALVITDSTTPEEAVFLADHSLLTKTALEQFNHYFETLYGMYENSSADLGPLQSVIRPLMAEQIVSTGSFGVDDLLASWASDPTRAPAVGTEFVSCSIYRPMTVQYYGSLPIPEMRDSFTQGLWVLLTVRQNGRLLYDLTSFVDVGGGNWLCYGNRRPFYSGGYVRARCEKTISAIGSVVYQRGLILWENDIGNSAMSNLGMTNMAIFNPAMPEGNISGMSGHFLRMARRAGGLSTEYRITDIPSQYGSSFYFHRGDGAVKDLDLAALAAQENKEFVMIGLNDADTPLYVWTQLLGAIPPDMGELVSNDDQYFATIQTPGDFSDVNIPGFTDVSWTLPNNDALLPFFGKLEWYNQNWSFQESYVYNPALFGLANYEDFFSTTMNTLGYYEPARQTNAAVMVHLPMNQSEFRVIREYNRWAPEAIAAIDDKLVFDIQKAYSDNVISSRLETRVRATDRAVNRIQVDLSVDLAEAEGNADTINNNMYAEIRLLYQPAENWYFGNRTDMFMVGVRLQPWFGRLYLVGYTWGSRNADASSLYIMPMPIGSFPFNTELAFGSSYTIAAEYIAATNSLRVEFNGQSSDFSLDGLPFDSANFQAADIRAQVVGIDNAGDRGRIRTSIDNVLLDGVGYDNFDAGIGINKWWVSAFE